MPGGLIRSKIFKRRAASAMSGVESSAKARDSDSASMPRSCSHSAGFAKGESGGLEGRRRKEELREIADCGMRIGERGESVISYRTIRRRFSNNQFLCRTGIGRTANSQGPLAQRIEHSQLFGEGPRRGASAKGAFTLKDRGKIEARHENLFCFAPDNVFVVSVAKATRTVCYLFLAQTTSSLFRLSIRASTFPWAS